MDENNYQNETTETIDQVKKRAMAALGPLLAELKDIDPQKKFEICMKAMRFTDDKNLAKTALDAALSIEGPGPKAQALVELINEIDYLETV